MDSLLEHFHIAVTTESDVKQLKKLILHLAFRGELVEQNQSDEPAKELLNKIEEKKEFLIKEKLLKMKKFLPVDKAKFNHVPTWEYVKLGVVAKVAGGSGFPLEFQGKLKGDYPFFKVGDLSRTIGKFAYQAENWLDKDDLSKKNFNLFEEGTIVFPKIGGALLTNNRKILRTKAIIDNNCMGVTPFVDSMEEFFFLFLTTIDMADYAVGTSIPSVSQSTVENLVLPIPPIEEQKRIIKKIGDLFAICDRLEEEIKQKEQASNIMNNSVFARIENYKSTSQLEDLQFAIQNMEFLFNKKEDIDLLRNSILTLAVQGKLVEQDVDDEQVSILLEKIKKEKEQLIKEKKIKKEQPLTQIIDEEQPFDLPRGWEWIRLGDIIYSTDAGKSPKCNDEPTMGDNWGVIKTTAIQKGNFLESHNKVLPQDFGISESYVIKKGDVLITRAGPKNRVGIVCCVENITKNLILSDKTIRLSLPNNLVLNRYISLALNSPSIRPFIESKMTGMAESQVNISQNNMRLFVIPLPPLNEQKRISEKVDKLMTFCNELEVNIEQSRKERENLMKAVLQEAFKVKEEVLS
ncbi:restriction endonuclease subunit S [Bacillus sp. AFS053548]|uniref:restriction endonuclease subunit S n=1 Tax=Bacillus sp. AFS053548 TaxID=2033505 RepID=UPI000BFD0A95|nr:restriction endonuclease subunit S [Bacillus sp. AFS053548]PGM59908.1 restriction endonuclease subunit S [Bacillus sp. AFS053548]